MLFFAALLYVSFVCYCVFARLSVCSCYVLAFNTQFSSCRFLPYVGMVTIQLTDYPMLKYVLVGLMGLFVITAKE